MLVDNFDFLITFFVIQVIINMRNH